MGSIITRLVLTTALMLTVTAPAGAHDRSGAPLLTGTLVERHGHAPNDAQTDTTYTLVTGRAERVLDDPQDLRLLGQHVELIDAETDQPGVQGRARAASDERLAAAPAPGPRTLLVILLTTGDAPQAAASPDAARQAVFTSPDSVRAFFGTQSGGRTTLVGRVRADGDVAGPFALATSTAGCDEDGFAAAADAAAAAGGWSPASYDHVLYVLPRGSACSWAGLGELPGRRAWTNGTLATSVIAHELGHNLGAHHANALTCGAATPFPSGCTSVEYGDPFDVMGSGPRLMSSWHRAQIGALAGDRHVRLTASADVPLTSSSAVDLNGASLLLVPRKAAREAVSSWLAIELRSQLEPFDLWDAGAAVTTGVTLRLVPSMLVPQRSQLIDAHPATTTLTDAPLQPGETFTDTERGIAIRLDGVESRVARVHVTMPTYVDDIAPSAPVIGASSGDTREVALRWSAATDDEAVDHYEIERNGIVVASTPDLTFADGRVAALEHVTYRVAAVDTTGNRALSEPVQLRLADVTAPGVVTGLTVRAAAAKVTLRWGAASDNRAVTGYRVARDGRYLGTTRRRSFTTRSVGGRHRFTVRAVDAAGNAGPKATVSATAQRRAGARPGPIRVTGRRWLPGRNVLVVRFSAARAQSMSGRVGGRLAASSSRSRLTVRVRLPRGARRHVTVVARNAAGSVRGGWTVR